MDVLCALVFAISFVSTYCLVVYVGYKLLIEEGGKE